MADHQDEFRFQNIPTEILSKILSKDTPKICGRFKTLSKYYRALLGQDHFVMQHKDELKRENDFGILLQRPVDFEPIRYLKTDHEPGYQSLNSHRFAEYLASYDSFVLICQNESTFIIKNPTTTSSFVLPFVPFNIPEDSNGCSCFFSLGFNSVDNDFFVLRLSIFNGWNMGSEAILFSKNANQWIALPPFPHVGSPSSDTGCYANGAFHWVVFGGEIAVFKIATMSWSTIDKPTSIGPTECFSQITSLNGPNLVLYQSYQFAGEDLKIYVMEDYPLKQSWKRIAVNVVMLWPIVDRLTFQPLYYEEPDRQRILFRGNQLDAYGFLDLKKETFQWVTEVPLYRIAASAFLYFKSLHNTD